MSSKDVLQVNLTGVNTVDEKKPYTVYVVEVHMGSYNWWVDRRYRAFHELHHQLLKKYGSTIALPTLPPKRLTGSLEPEFVEKRRQELQEYLRELVQKIDVGYSDDLCFFLEIPENLRHALLESGSSPDKNTAPASGKKQRKGRTGTGRSRRGANADEERVFDLLTQLEAHPNNKVSALRDFEAYFFEAKPRLRQDVIMHLLQGDSEGGVLGTPGLAAHPPPAALGTVGVTTPLAARNINATGGIGAGFEDLKGTRTLPPAGSRSFAMDRDTLPPALNSPSLLKEPREGGSGHVGGLIQQCGDFEHSSVSSCAALDLLCRLLDFEHNKDAESFIDTFLLLDPAMAKKIKLSVHILSERGSRRSAFRLISLLRTRQPELQLSLLLDDPWAIQEYFKWVDTKGDEPSRNVHQESSNRRLVQAVSLDQGCERVGEQAVQELLAVANSTDGWRKVMTDKIGSEIEVTYKKHSLKENVILRIVGTMAASPEIILDLISDLNERKVWDSMYQDGSLVEQCDACSSIVHLVYKAKSSPYKHRDFCLLRTCKLRTDGSIVVASRSVLHPRVPTHKDHVRAEALPSGFILTPAANLYSPPSSPLPTGSASSSSSSSKLSSSSSPSSFGSVLASSLAQSNRLSVVLNPPSSSKTNHRQSTDWIPAMRSEFLKGHAGETQVTFVGQLNQDGIVIVAPDLLGETSELLQSFRNLKAAALQRTLQKNSISEENEDEHLEEHLEATTISELEVTGAKE